MKNKLAIISLVMLIGSLSIASIVIAGELTDTSKEISDKILSKLLVFDKNAKITSTINDKNGILWRTNSTSNGKKYVTVGVNK